MIKRIFFKQFLFLLIFSLSSSFAFSQSLITFDGGKERLIDDWVSTFIDKTNHLTIDSIINSNNFKPNKTKTISEYFSSGKTFWFKFRLSNHSDQNKLYLSLNSALINEAKLFKVAGNKISLVGMSGIDLPFKERKIKESDIIFGLAVPPNDTATTFFLKIKSAGSLNLDLKISDEDKIFQDNLVRSIITGVYLGVFLALFFYNFFIFYSVKDKTYFFYIFYILFIWLSQFSLFGYTYKFLWPNSPFINQQSIILLPVIAGIFAILFSKDFLATKTQAPIFNRGFNLFILLYLIAFSFSISGFVSISYKLMDITALLLVAYALVVSLIILIKGNKSALFYLISFATFMIAMYVYVLKNAGIITSNSFSNYSLYIGTTVQAVLLSLALADKINVYKEEKEISQAQAIQALKEKEEFASQQNVILEKKVYDRTTDLEKTNSNLELTLKQLKESQSQLVDAEKMASLGQLTAGIAHEINNPINFVKSNVKPLQLDIEDIRALIKKYEEMHAGNFDEKLGEIQAFREEIDFGYVMDEIKTLLSGIEDGASRTADIVKGLRTFSRLDESDLKEADIHDGINNTLMLLNHTIPKSFSVIRNYQDLPKVECYPGKLNQVFMNLLTNAIQAMESNVDGKDKKIIISTERLNESIIIRIADTGPGIPEEVRDRIFEPFFTTKEVGEGTGLGLSIVYNIIEKHHGNITVRSEENKGTEFVITLPLRQSDFLNVNAGKTTSISEEPLNH